MKSAEQLLSDFDVNIDKWPDTKSLILQAMEEYKNQSYTSPPASDESIERKIPTYEEIKVMAAEFYPDNMGGMDQKGVERYRTGYVVGFNKALQATLPVPVSQVISYVPYQLCPKCHGDGNLARYNSPNIGTNASPLCDVCNGAKTIPMLPII